MVEVEGTTTRHLVRSYGARILMAVAVFAAVGGSPGIFAEPRPGEVQVFSDRNGWTLEQVLAPPAGVSAYGSALQWEWGRSFVGGSPFDAPGAVVEGIDQLERCVARIRSIARDPEHTRDAPSVDSMTAVTA